MSTNNEMKILLIKQKKLSKEIEDFEEQIKQFTGYIALFKMKFTLAEKFKILKNTTTLKHINQLKEIKTSILFYFNTLILQKQDELLKLEEERLQLEKLLKEKKVKL